MFDFAEALRLDPKNVRARMCRAACWDEKEDQVKAIADYDLAIRLSPKNAYA